MDPDDALDRMRRRDEVRGDIERLRAQAGRLSAVWTGIRMDGPDVVVLLTDPDPYVGQLRALVEHPDRLQVRRSRYSRTQLDRVHGRVIDLIGEGSWSSHWPGLERVGVALHADRAELAALLHERFGDAVDIELGRHRFPLDRAVAVTPPPAPRSTIDLPGVTCTVHPDALTYPTGATIRGHVTIRNGGVTTLELNIGRPAFGVLLDARHDVVGDWTGVTTLTGRPVWIAPGADLQRRFIAGSDTFDPALGASLPPGTYLLVIPIEIGVRDAGRDGDPQPSDRPRPRRRPWVPGGTLATDPIPIALTAKAG